MTNEEAIRILKDITWNSNGRYEITDMLDTRNLSIQALEENTKLKAEIEQLKSELEQSDSCDGCKHELERNEYYCDGCKRISVDSFELKSEVSE